MMVGRRRPHGISRRSMTIAAFSTVVEWYDFTLYLYFATVLAREIRVPKVEVRKLFDIVRDDVWAATKHTQQPFTYGSPPGREDFYFVAEK